MLGMMCCWDGVLLYVHKSWCGESGAGGRGRCTSMARNEGLGRVVVSR
jgi:hypothetical protein